MICCWPPPEPLVASIPVGQGPAPLQALSQARPRSCLECSRAAAEGRAAQLPVARLRPAEHHRTPHLLTLGWSWGWSFSQAAAPTWAFSQRSELSVRKRAGVVWKGLGALVWTLSSLLWLRKKSSFFWANSYQFKIAVLVLSSLLHGHTGVQCNH